MTTISGQRRPVIPRHVTKGTCALIYYLQSSVQCVNDKISSIYVYLTIIPRGRVGYEMIDSQRGA